jgi:hypothetical protein
MTVNFAEFETLLWKREGSHGIIEIVDERTFLNPVLNRGPAGREQYGNNLGRKPSQMIPNDPKSALH